MVSFDVNEKDTRAIVAIAKRAVIQGVSHDFLKTEMDVAACHANGMSLDLEKLLKSPDGDFIHDITGIARHINRETGAIEDCFVPRCHKPCN